MSRIPHLIRLMRCGLEELEEAHEHGDQGSVLTAMDTLTRGYCDLEEELGLGSVEDVREKIGGTDPD